MTLIRNTLVCVSTLLAAHLVAAEEVVSVYVSLDREHSEKVIAQFEQFHESLEKTLHESNTVEQYRTRVTQLIRGLQKKIEN